MLTAFQTFILATAGNFFWQQFSYRADQIVRSSREAAMLRVLSLGKMVNLRQMAQQKQKRRHSRQNQFQGTLTQYRTSTFGGRQLSRCDLAWRPRLDREAFSVKFIHLSTTVIVSRIPEAHTSPNTLTLIETGNRKLIGDESNDDASVKTIMRMHLLSVVPAI